MNVSMMNSLVGMKALQQKIDTVANNIANINTTGFKGKEVLFEDILSARLSQQDDFLLTGRKTPLGVDEGIGAKTALTHTRFTQGQPIQTGIATDFMLSGDDIFFTTVSEPNTNKSANIAPEQLRFTRDGNFKIDADGYLVTSQGDFVLNQQEEAIKVPTGATLQVNRQGEMLAKMPDGQEQNLGNLNIYRIQTPQSLEAIGDNQYKIAEELLQQSDNFIESIDIDSNSEYAVMQGNLEASNVDMSTEMTQLLEAQRAYQFQAKGLTIAEQMQGMANSLRG